VSAAGGSWLISFRVGGAEAALPLGVVREVTARPPITRVPGSHPFVTGIALHGGVALPVYDLVRFAPLWSGPRPVPAEGLAGEAEHVIVCDWGEARVGLLGDGVDLLEAVQAGNAPGGAQASRCRMSAAYVREILRRDDEAVLLLDPERLFASLGVPAAEPTGVGEGGGEDDPARR